MNILALDLGTTTGWALREGDHLESGVQTFEVKRGESPGMRYLAFRRWLRQIAQPECGARCDGTCSHPIVGLIVYEQTHHRGGAATEVSANFAGRVQEYVAEKKCEAFAIEHAAVHSATLKKWTTGKGNAKKPDMIAAVARRWARDVTDDNEADALALLHYALAEIVPKGEEDVDADW